MEEEEEIGKMQMMMSMASNKNSNSLVGRKWSSEDVEG